LRRSLRPVAQSAPTHTLQISSIAPLVISALLTSPLGHCALDNGTILPLISRQEFLRQRRYVLILTLAHDNQVEPVPAPTSYPFSTPISPPHLEQGALVNSSRSLPATNGGSLAWLRRSANRPCIRTRATMAILPSQGTSRVPQLWSPLLPRSSHHQHQVSPNGYLVRIYRSSPLFLDLSMCSSTLPLAGAQPQSPPTRPSPTQTSPAARMLSMVKLIMYRHVRMGVFRFPFVHLTHITSRSLIALRFVPMTL